MNEGTGVPYRSKALLEEWVHDFLEQGHSIAGSLNVLLQDGIDGRDTGLVIVHLQNMFADIYMQPRGFDNPLWEATLTGSPEDLALTPYLQLVLVDRASSLIEADAVLVDGPRATYEAVNHLIEHGHRRIAFLGELRNPLFTTGVLARTISIETELFTLSPSEARLAGYVDALHAAHIPIDSSLVYASDSYSTKAARDIVADHMSASTRPTAIVVADGVMTLGAYQAIRDREIRMPDEISLIGFDDQDWTSLVAPPVTVIDQPAPEIGRRSASLLIARLNQGAASPPVLEMLSTGLIHRGSVGPVLVVLGVAAFFVYRWMAKRGI